MDNIIRRNLRSSTVFKNESSLLREFVPEMLPRREEELKRLSRDFRPLVSEEGAYSVNVALVGNAGVGKTAIARYFGERLPKAAANINRKILCLYFNCFTFRTKSSILRHIMNKNFNVLSTKGFSDTELLSDLMRRLVKEKLHLVLILDEANVLGSESILEFIIVMINY
ncbi:MAG: AAA family ATPase [Candidatus Hodarchaeota archaeon]